MYILLNNFILFAYALVGNLFVGWFLMGKIRAYS